MKAKLHKMVSGYILSLNGDIDDPYAIVNEELAKDHEWYRLSLKNCQAIERGYDLDKLAIEYFKQIHMGFGIIEAYKKGFQDALEILSDKKFSEEDVKFAFNKGYLMKFNPSAEYQKTLNDLRQSLQQTEWDCIVEMECPTTGCDIECDIDCYEPNKKPKLDSDGCLILKKL